MIGCLFIMSSTMKDTKKIFDGLLVLEHQNGNKKAFGILVGKHHKDFCRYALWYTKDEQLSQDIVQECWTVIIRKLGTLKNPNSFKSWALRIIIRKSQDQMNKLARKRKFMKEYNAHQFVETDPEESKSEEIKQLRTAIKKLSFDQQMVVRLFYTEEYSLKEISNILDISEGTVKSRLYHSREKLKSILNK